MLTAFVAPIRAHMAYKVPGPACDLTPGKPKCSLTREYASAGSTFEIWKRLTPAPLPVTPDFDPLVDYPTDIERIVTAAANLGFKVMQRSCGGGTPARGCKLV